MAKKIKGITVQIGGNTSGLTKALSDADKSLAATQKEINEVQKSLKLDPSSVTLMAQKQELLTQAIADTSSKLKALEDNADKAKKALAANAEWERQFKPLKEQIDKAKESLSKLKAEQEEAKKKFEAGEISAEDFDKVKAKTQEAREALKKLEDQKAELNKQFADGHISEEEYRAYQREVENTRAQLQGLQTELRNTSAVTEEQKKKITDFGTHAKESFAAVVKAAAAITAALVAIGKKAVEVGTEFDSAMSQVAATMGYSVEAINTEGTEANKTFKQLRDYAQEMGKSTAFSANSAAEALNYLALSGKTAEESMKMLPGLLDLASAGNMELAKTSDVVTDAQSALGLSIEDTEKLIDQMARTASKSNTSVEQLGEAILTIGATAKDMKGGTQELAEVLGLLADNGIKGAEGGTKLRNILLKLEAPTDKAAAKLEELGVQVLDDNDKLRSMQDIFADLSEALKDTGNRTGELSKIFNSRDLAAVNALLDTSADRWNELGEAIEDSAGAAHDMAEVQLDNLAGDITLFKSALEGAEITISDKLNPKLRETVQFGTEMVSRLADGFGQGGLAGAVEQAHKVIAEQLGEDAKLVYGVETAVESCIAAFVTYKATMLLSEGIAALKTVNQLLIEGKTLTEALNAASMANPYVLIATIAISAGMAVKKLIQIQTDLIDETSNGYDLLDDKQKEIADNAKKISSEIGKSRAEYKKNREAIDEQTESYRLMADKLYELNNAQEMNSDIRRQMKTYVDKLNGAIKGLNIELDGETGRLKTQKETVDALIDSYDKQAKAQAAQQHLTDLYDQQISAEIARKNALDEVTEAEKKLLDLTEKKNIAARAYNDAVNSFDDTNVQISTEQIDELKERYEAATKAVQDQKDRLGELNTAYVAAGDTLAGVNGDIEAANELIGEMGGAISGTAETAGEGFDKIADGAEDMANSVEISSEELAEKLETTTSKIEELINAYESKLASRTGTLQSWFEVNATVSGEEASFTALSTALNKQISSFEKWKDDIAQLEREGINQNFLDKLKDAGPQSQELVSALLSVSPEQRNAYAGAWDEAYQSAADVAKTQLEGMREETETQISTMLSEIETLSPEFAATFGDLADSAVDGYINKIKERLPELKEWGKAIGSETMDGEKEETETASPSKKWAELGEYAVEGYEKGIKDSMSKAVSAARKMADDAMNAVSRAQSGGATLAGVKSAGAAVRATAEAQAGTPSAAQVVVESSIKPADIENAVRNVLTEALSGAGQGTVYMDGREVGTIVYPFVDVLQGKDVEVSTRGGA